MPTLRGKRPKKVIMDEVQGKSTVFVLAASYRDYMEWVHNNPGLKTRVISTSVSLLGMRLGPKDTFAVTDAFHAQSHEPANILREARRLEMLRDRIGHTTAATSTQLPPPNILERINLLCEREWERRKYSVYAVYLTDTEHIELYRLAVAKSGVSWTTAAQAAPQGLTHLENPVTQELIEIRERPFDDGEFRYALAHHYLGADVKVTPDTVDAVNAKFTVDTSQAVLTIKALDKALDAMWTGRGYRAPIPTTKIRLMPGAHSPTWVKP